MTTEKIRAALNAFGELLDALESSAGWDAAPLRARIADAEGELDGAGEPAPVAASPQPCVGPVPELLAVIDALEFEPEPYLPVTMVAPELPTWML